MLLGTHAGAGRGASKSDPPIQQTRRRGGEGERGWRPREIASRAYFAYPRSPGRGIVPEGNCGGSCGVDGANQIRRSETATVGQSCVRCRVERRSEPISDRPAHCSSAGHHGLNHDIGDLFQPHGVTGKGLRVERAIGVALARARSMPDVQPQTLHTVIHMGTSRAPHACVGGAACGGPQAL